MELSFSDFEIILPKIMHRSTVAMDPAEILVGSKIQLCLYFHGMLWCIRYF
jgi:hypothetical protein